MYGLLGSENIWQRYNYVGIWGCKKNLNIEKIIFKVVQMKFLAMHNTNQKLSLNIFTVRNVLNIFMEHDLYLKLIILTHTVYFWLLLQNIPQRLKTAFVLQGHI